MLCDCDHFGASQSEARASAHACCGATRPLRPALCKNSVRMVDESAKVRILLIRPWTEPLSAFRSALTANGIRARISRVDIEPALDAALSRTSYDVVVLDPRTPGITREMVDAMLREHRRIVHVVIFDELDGTVAAVAHALRNRFN